MVYTRIDLHKRKTNVLHRLMISTATYIYLYLVHQITTAK